ncbi:hypothetical protein [Sutcliffiella horikoshii]|uniref:hypothetical protein n=1 Tax=Sutcliffiella horikoshii TaxID=79883 RepID=UPI001F34D3B4|nr:hypothetical protein [Sutcliffiella horikoshii]MCG1022002.1 hypothetical protein [Sutcliffiella horikoshii]
MYFGRAIISILFLSLLFLAGCSVSIEDASQKSIDAFEQTFKAEEMEATEETDAFHYYLPSQFSVDTETENNIVLTHKEQTYLLFVNPFESKDSEVLYDSTKVNYDELELDHTVSEDGRLGYLLISPVEGEKEEFYEVTVGVGGVKMTTVTDTKNMESSTKSMMEVVSSVKIK